MLSARLLSMERSAMLLSLSLVIEFLRKVFTNFIFEKLLSHEGLVTGRVTVINSNLYKQSNAALYGAKKQRNSITDVSCWGSLFTNFLTKDISCCKSY